MSIDFRTGRCSWLKHLQGKPIKLKGGKEGGQGTYGMVEIAGKMILSEESSSKTRRTGERNGHHKKLVRKSQISDKLQIFFAPRERKGEIPKQPKNDNVKILENVPLKDTFVPFINERSGIGHLIPKVSAFLMFSR